VLAELFDPGLSERFPLLRRVEAVKRVAVVVITSNRGLCGGFNANLIRMAQQRLEALSGAGAEVELHGIGRKGIGYFRYVGQALASQRIDIGDRPTPQHAVEVAEPLMERFAGGELDGVEVVFAKFNSPVSTPPTVVRVLPIEPPPARPTANYIVRPSAEAILEALLPLYLHNQLYRALVETAAAEQGARRTAMKNATDSAGEMIDWLRRTYNRARQAQITQEIAEIVGGSEALKG